MSQTLVIEGLLTTLNEQGEMNVAPMGPQITRQPTIETFVLRPFESSTTYHNLKATGEGVFHITDDARMLAEAAIGSIQPPAKPAQQVKGMVLTDVCRYYEFKVVHWDDTLPRPTLQCDVVRHGRLRDFVGFNRAKHAILEAAILATRRHLPGIDIEATLAQLQPLEVIVQKTAGRDELETMTMLKHYIRHGPPGNPPEAPRTFTPETTPSTLKKDADAFD